MNQVSPCFFTAREDGKYVVSYEITNVCNMNCMHCMNKSGKNEYVGMDISAIKEMFKEMALQDIHYIYISGGEPLLHPDFEKVLECAANYGFQIILATNGILIPEYIEVIKRYVSDVSISLDGLNSVHDEFRGIPRAFEGVVRAVKLLKDHGVYVRFSTVLWKKSVEQLNEIVQFAEELGISKINLSIIVPTGRTIENDIQIPWDMYPDLLEQIEKLQYKYNDNGKMQLILRRCKSLDENSADCIGGNPIMHINAHGRISPCSWCSKADKNDEFSMQWEIGKMKECIEKCRSIEELIKVRKLKYGYSGCPAIAYFQNGNMLDKDPINDMLKGYVGE